MAPGHVSPHNATIERIVNRGQAGMNEDSSRARRPPQTHMRRLSFLASACALGFFLLPCLLCFMVLILNPGTEAPWLVRAAGLAMALVCLWLIKGCLKTLRSSA
jgi:hypothetical protein